MEADSWAVAGRRAGLLGRGLNWAQPEPDLVDEGESVVVGHGLSDERGVLGFLRLKGEGLVVGLREEGVRERMGGPRRWRWWRKRTSSRRDCSSMAVKWGGGG